MDRGWLAEFRAHGIISKRSEESRMRMLNLSTAPASVKTILKTLLLQTLLMAASDARGSVILTNLFSFQNLQTGYDPRPRLVLHTNGLFYGTTSAGGAYDMGTVFAATPGGQVTTLVTFNGTNGHSP